MYAPFFGLKQEPFSIAPDPRFLFMSERHREALAHLLYGVRGGGGFVLLTGEIGAGKTTVCRCFLEQIPKRCNVAYIFNPKLSVDELLKSVCDEFGVPCEVHSGFAPTVKDYVDALNEYLLRTHAVGQNNVLIIDEAQNLSAEVLEQLRLLTNLETNERKLLQIMLIGQPELRAMLGRGDLEQLAQRVVARYHLDALTEAETEQYICHRLGVAGMRRSLPFDRSALRRIFRLSRGVPRRINLLCDRALLGAYASGASAIDRTTVDKAAAEVFGPSVTDSFSAVGARRRLAWAAGLGLAIGGLLFGTAATLVGRRANSEPGPAHGVAVAKAERPTASAVSRTASGIGPTAASAPAGMLPQAALMTSATEALQALAADWNIHPDAGDPCEAALRQGFDCFRGNGTSLAMIRQLDRPGILTLYPDDSGQPVYALLEGLSDQAALIRTAAGSQPVALVALAGAWRGDFSTYWRTPPGYDRKPADGLPGPLTDWLKANLTSSSGAGHQNLDERVAAFQLTQGLKPDGLAGPITLMQLNRVAGVKEPRLRH